MKSLIAAAVFTSTVQAQTVTITDWANSGLDGWESKSFSGETQYTLKKDDGESFVNASSQAAASGLFHEMAVDLTKTPILNWRWRVPNALPGLDERSKSGDDYSARIYVVVDGGAFFWRTRALNYVWSGSQAAGSTWPNAYTGNAQMFAIRGKGSATGKWVTEQRNLREDFQNLIGKDIEQIDAIAIMTDTDNSGLSTTADYAEIWFSAK